MPSNLHGLRMAGLNATQKRHVSTQMQQFRYTNRLKQVSLAHSQGY